jgi:hypothetical protein
MWVFILLSQVSKVLPRDFMYFRGTTCFIA